VPLESITKIKIGSVDDPVERRVDSVAERAIKQAPSPSAIRSQTANHTSSYQANTATAEPIANQLGIDIDKLRLHRAPKIDQMLDALGANGASLGSEIFIHSSLKEGSREHTRVVAHELAHAQFGHRDGVIRRSPKTKKNELPVKKQEQMIYDIQAVPYSVSSETPPDLAFRNHTSHELSRMSNLNLKIYVSRFREVRKTVERNIKAVPYPLLWESVLEWLESHWTHVVQRVASTRAMGMRALSEWSDYANATYDYSLELAKRPDSGLKNQTDGFTPSELKAAQHRFIFIHTWATTQDYIQAAYFKEKAPTPSTKELLRYGYVTAEAVEKFYNVGCAGGRTPADFYRLLNYFPMEVAKIVIKSPAPEVFAKKFGELIDIAMKGQAIINSTNAQWNEAESRKHWCPSGERSPLSISKWALLDLRNKYDNVFLASAPEADPNRLFARRDYSGLHAAMRTPLNTATIESYNGNNVNLSGIANPEDMSKYLSSGIDKSGLPTTIDF
jgi:hypothetical protein